MTSGSLSCWRMSVLKVVAVSFSASTHRLTPRSETVNLADVELLRAREIELLRFAKRRLAGLNEHDLPDINKLARRFLHVQDMFERARSPPVIRRRLLEATNVALDMIRIARSYKRVISGRKAKTAELNRVLEQLAAPKMTTYSPEAHEMPLKQELAIARHYMRNRKEPFRIEAEAALKPFVDAATEELRRPLTELWTAVAPFGITPPPPPPLRPVPKVKLPKAPVLGPYITRKKTSKRHNSARAARVEPAATDPVAAAASEQRTAETT